MPDTQIFKATYSGVPVYEMMCKGVAVMRRRVDGWLNATQILKVAGFDKPQRTRVLERDVQKGIHEKVQGGYGKYQGTWIPLDRGLAIAKQFNCDHLLRPIIEFQPEAESPPLAPKHLVAPVSGRPAARRVQPEAPTNTVSTRSTRRTVGQDAVSYGDDISAHGSEDGSMSPSPSEHSSVSTTPSPLRETPDNHTVDEAIPEEPRNSQASSSRNRQSKRTVQKVEPLSDLEQDDRARIQAYCDEILEYFISDTNQVPQILVNPPQDFDPNMSIDDDGHSTLHWAAAMGRIRVVKLLLTAGADIYKVNKAGQTALMRSVMFANNYDVRKFPELYELLHESTENIDNFNRTVFHHIVDVAMSKGKTHAARYYMETILNGLSMTNPSLLADIINFQDEDGETALTMAARCRSKRLVKLLLDHGADPKIVNSDLKSTEDYILEDARFRSSPSLTSRSANLSFRNQQASLLFGDGRPILHYSVTAQRATTQCLDEMATMVDNLAMSFDQELKEKERDLNQAHALLSNIQTEILDSQRVVGQLKAQAQGFDEAMGRLRALEGALTSKMTKRYRLGYEKWMRDEEERERKYRQPPDGNAIPYVPQGELLDTDGILATANTLVHLNLKRKLPPDEADQDPLPSAQPQLNDQHQAQHQHQTQQPQPHLNLDEDITDLTTLYADLPLTTSSLSTACAALRTSLDRHRKRRKESFVEYVRLQAEAGTSGRMNRYRRLIGACAGVDVEEVDGVVDVLLETLEAEEPSASATAWADASGTGSGSLPKSAPAQAANAMAVS